MTLSLRGRMAAVALAASAAALLSLLLFVGPGRRREATSSVRDVLLAEARLMARVVEEPLVHGVSSEELDRLVDEAIAAVDAAGVGAKGDMLRATARFVAMRKN